MGPGAELRTATRLHMAVQSAFLNKSIPNRHAVDEALTPKLEGGMDWAKLPPPEPGRAGLVILAAAGHHQGQGCKAFLSSCKRAVVYARLTGLMPPGASKAGMRSCRNPLTGHGAPIGQSL